MTAEQVRDARVAREQVAADIAARIGPGSYCAYENDVVQHGTHKVMATCASHWDACLVLLAVGRLS
jgi:hypothetical protein